MADAPLSCSIIQGAQGDNLRNRVSAITYQEVYNTDNCFYDHATHFSYDAHGNVKRIVQDFPDLKELEQRYKVIDYKFDLISGNVLQVNYQGRRSRSVLS